jgi:NADH-quinone oxidoreductase subunit E
MDLKPVDDILTRHPQVTGNLISVLHEVQSHYSYLPEDALRHLARKSGVPITRLFSIATFYHLFSLQPKGRHQIHVCLGTACHVKGGHRILEDFERKLGVRAGETTPDMRYTVDEVRCVGACSFAPAVVVGETMYAGVTPKKVSEILKKHR